MSVYLFVSVILLGIAVLLSLFLKTPATHHISYTPVHPIDTHQREGLVLKPGSSLVLTETN